MKQLQESFDKPRPQIVLDAVPIRTGIHLSDLLQYRQTFFKRAMPKPTAPDEALYFLAGRAHEDVYGRIAGLVPGVSRIVDGVSYRPDFRWFNLPTEFKSRRSNLAKAGEETNIYDSYLTQLKGYCTYDQSPMGILIVFSMLEGRSADPLKRTHPEIAVYDVFFAQRELDDFRIELARRKRTLEEALSLGTFDKLDLCSAWICGKPTKVVEKPPYCKTCEREFATQWGIEKHLGGKSGAGHDVVGELYHWLYEPRCKWYAECQPQLVDPQRGQR